MTDRTYTLEEVRLAAEADLLSFIRLVAPQRVLGDIHKETIRWWTREDAGDHQLLLIPRDHQKSYLAALRALWAITKNPAVTILYISSTSKLAEKQLGLIKQILESKIYRKYWPDMTLPEETKRNNWTKSEIEVDHPLRKKEVIRDPTILTAGLTTSITGLHFDIAILDDVVVQENAYTTEGRNKVERQYSLLSSIESVAAEEWVVGTRYHPKDLYGQMLEMEAEVIDEHGITTSKMAVYEIMERQVEENGDGSGDYLWPRQCRADGRWFGFNSQILAIKRAKYLNKSQFRAQYYNDPNDPDNENIASSLFQYYDRKFLERQGDTWRFQDKPLNVFAAIDFAFSLTDKADFTALVTIGVTAQGDIYVLDIDRFKTNLISVYYNKMFEAYTKWGFRKIRAEVTVAQDVIVEDLKQQIRRGGIALSIDRFRPDRYSGSKEERMRAALNPRYENNSIWHYQSGITSELEDELRQQHPRHDDIKDALANAVAISRPPLHGMNIRKKSNVVYHPRYGGVVA